MSCYVVSREKGLKETKILRLLSQITTIHQQAGEAVGFRPAKVAATKAVKEIVVGYC